jgi:hypothetical protein
MSEKGEPDGYKQLNDVQYEKTDNVRMNATMRRVCVSIVAVENQ